MFQIGKKLQIPTVIFLIAIVGWYFLLYQPVNQTEDSLNNSKLSPQKIADIQKYGTSTEAYNSYTGIISQNTKGQNVYTSPKYRLSFIYPQGWNVGDNHLGYGTLQFFSPDVKGGTDYIAVGNKIEVAIVAKNPPGTIGDVLFPAGYSTTTEVVVAGKPVKRTDANYPAGGAAFVSYTIPLPDIPNKYLVISIYGNPLNSYILDDLVKSITWTAQ